MGMRKRRMMNKTVEEALEKLKIVMREAGFNEISIDDQLERLSTLITFSTINRIAKNGAESVDKNRVADEQAIEQYLNDNFDDQEFKTLISDVAEEKTSLFLSSILSELDQPKREEIINKIRSLESSN